MNSTYNKKRNKLNNMKNYFNKINILKTIFSLLLITFSLSLFSQTTYHTYTQGNWNDEIRIVFFKRNIWHTTSCGQAIPNATNYPDGNVHVVICEDDVMTLNIGGVEVENLTIESGGVLDLGNRDLIVNGNLILNGTILTQNGELTITGGIGTTISGGGVFSSSSNADNGGGCMLIEGDVEIDGTNLRILGDNLGNQIINVGNGVVITNSGNTTVYGDIVASDGDSEWINASNATLKIDGMLVPDGKLDANASGNTIEYSSSTNALNITTPTDAAEYNNLYINGTTYKTQQDNITINGNFEIKSGTYVCGSNEIEIKGNWTNKGVFSYGTGTVTFNGTANQTIISSSDENFYNLTINKAATNIVLENNITVRNTLTMTSGNFEGETQKVTLGYDALNCGTLSWNKGYTTGYFERWLSETVHNGVQVEFPVGITGSNRAMKPTYTFGSSGGGSLTVRFVQSDPGRSGFNVDDNGTSVYNTFVDGYWETTDNGLMTYVSSHNLALHGTDFTAFSTADNTTTRILARENSTSNWLAIGTHVDATAIIANRTGISQTPTVYSEFCFGTTIQCVAPTAITITGLLDVCTEDQVTYTASGNTGSEYTWTFENSAGTVFSQTNNTATIDWGTAGTIETLKVVEKNTCTYGAQATLEINVHSILPNKITGDMSVPVSTTGQAYVAEMNDYTDYTFSWNVVGGSIVDDGNATDKEISINWNATAGDGTISVTSTYSGCNVSYTSTDTTVLKYEVIESVRSGDWDYVGNFPYLFSTWNCQCIPSADDNVKINDGHVIRVEPSNATSGITNIEIEPTGEIDLDYNNFVISGDLTVDGTFGGSSGVELSGNGTSIGGIGGNITTAGTIDITGNKTINSTTNLTFSGGDVDIASGVTVTNNGSITIAGYDLNGADATSKWINDENSYIIIDGTILTVGELTATAANNTVHYNGTTQNILTPKLSTYYNLETTGGTQTQQVNLILSGDLTINSGTFDGNDKTLNIGGDWTNSGIYTSTNTSVTFDGTEAQSITNNHSGTETFHNLTISKASETLTLIDHVNINETLTMTNGNIDANGYTLALGGSSEKTLNHSSGSIIGNFEMYLSTSGTKLFPLGTASVYHPITFNFITAPTEGTILASFSATDPGLNGTTFPFLDNDNNVTDYFNDGYWRATTYNLASANFNIEVTATGFDDDGTFEVNSATRILKRTTGVWGVEGDHVKGTSNIVKRDAMTLIAGTAYRFGVGDSDCATFTAPTIIGNDNVCGGDQDEPYSIILNDVGNTTDWTVVKGTIDDNNIDDITVDWQATPGVLAYVRVSESSTCYDAEEVEKEITLHSLPTSTITGPENVFDDSQDWPYDITNRTGYTYTWTIDDYGIITVGQSTSSIEVDWSAIDWVAIAPLEEVTTTMRVSGKYGTCTASTEMTLEVTIFKSFITENDGIWNDVNTWKDITNAANIPGNGENIKILNNVSISATDATSIDNLFIGSAGILTQNGGFDLAITSSYKNNGTQDGGTTGDILFNASTTGLTIAGTSGTIQNFGELQINNHNYNIISSASLTINGNVAIGANVLIENEGSVEITGNITGGNSSSYWNNAQDATLYIGGNLFSTNGKLYASATNNTIEYNGGGAQNILKPESSEYYNLEISNNTKTQQTKLIISGNLSINSGTFASANNDIDLYGNWSNSGTYTQGSGLLSLKGSTNQSITNSGVEETFSNLTINSSNSIDVTLNDPLRITGNLNLYGSYIASTATNKVIFDTGATCNGGEADSYVKGPVSKIGTDAFTFPTGYDNIWARIGITAPSASSTFTTEYFWGGYSDLTVTGLLTKASEKEYWDLSRDAGTGTTSVTLYWEDSTRSRTGDVAYIPDLRVAHYNGTGWEDAGNAGFLAEVAGYVTSSQMSSFSPITLGSVGTNNPLPIELLDFTAKANPNNIDLYWATATETNNDFFEIERSTDGIYFETILNTAGAGNSSVRIDYTETDYSPVYGTAYYRLKQSDYNGDFSYSPIVSVFWNANGGTSTSGLSVYPNPFSNGDLTLETKNIEPGKSIQLMLTDFSGRTIYNVSLVNPDNQEINLIPMAINKLPQGMYIISVFDGKNFSKTKLVVE